MYRSDDPTICQHYNFLFILADGFSDNDIVQKASMIIKKEYTERVFEKIKKCDKINNLSPNLGALLVDHARSVLIMREAIEISDASLRNHIEEYEKKLKTQYSIKSKISSWLSDCLSKEKVC